LNEISTEAAELSSEQGWPEKTPEERFLYVVSELGELADAMLQLGSITDAREKARLTADLADEMYDVVWNVCDLARLLGVDLDAAAARKTQANRARSWETKAER